MMHDYDRRRLGEIGKNIASDWSNLKRDGKSNGMGYPYMFGRLKVICEWLYEKLVEEVAGAEAGAEAGADAMKAAEAEAVGHFGMLDDSGGVQ